MKIRHRARALAAGGAAVWLAGSACKDQGPDPLACQQTFGFGNYGCADLSGTVLDAQNNPVANATVSAGASLDVYDHAQVITDASGKFAVRLLRRWIQTNPEMDTVSTWIHASVSAPTAMSDSLFTQIRFYPLRQRPVTTAFILHIGAP